MTTNYTLDLNAGLTQVLGDGTNTYVYGVNRIAQVSETQIGYFLPDALGSVRHMADENGEITLAQSYTPYGEEMASEGAAQTAYAFTGENYGTRTLQSSARKTRMKKRSSVRVHPCSSASNF